MRKKIPILCISTIGQKSNEKCYTGPAFGIEKVKLLQFPMQLKDQLPQNVANIELKIVAN